METYKFDWKDTVTGNIEIEASSGKEAEEKFKNIPSEELYKQSKWNSDGKNRSIRFVETEGPVMGLLPVVGVPLPLISYGGSSMLTTMFGLGLVSCVYVHRNDDIEKYKPGLLGW